jgi:hypothetical protein
MFFFIKPFLDGTVWTVTIGAKDLDEAYDQYRRYHWNVETTGAVGVWMNHALLARVVPVYDEATEENYPKLELWP